MAEKVVFHRSLYSEKAVRDAALAYGGLLDLSIEAQEHGVTVILKSSTPVDPELVDAFCNHALHATILDSHEVSQ